MLSYRLGTLPIFIESDPDFGGQQLRKFFTENHDSIFFYIFNYRLLIYLRARMEYIIKEQSSIWKNQLLKDQNSVKNAMDALIKAKQFPAVEKRLRMSSFHNMHAIFMKNLRSTDPYLDWLTQNAPDSPLSPTKPSHSKMKSKKLAPEVDEKSHVEHIGQFRRDFYRKVKNLFRHQIFIIEFDQVFITALVYTIWNIFKREKEKKTV